MNRIAAAALTALAAATFAAPADAAERAPAPRVGCHTTSWTRGHDGIAATTRRTIPRVACHTTRWTRGTAVTARVVPTMTPVARGSYRTFGPR